VHIDPFHEGHEISSTLNQHGHSMIPCERSWPNRKEFSASIRPACFGECECGVGQELYACVIWTQCDCGVGQGTLRRICGSGRGSCSAPTGISSREPSATGRCCCLDEEDDDDEEEEEEETYVAEDE
jgi:hypothetical protein